MNVYDFPIKLNDHRYKNIKRNRNMSTNRREDKLSRSRVTDESISKD